MSEIKNRPPVVTILGHVDHGKTSLLDRIRNANVASGEVGGITQAIGAYQIVYQGKKITFIDTPGHAAFSAMRARGGKAADIALLIIAADDSVMPQTRESIEHIKSANIPYVVVVNKTDLEGVNVEKVKSDLASSDVYVEGYGGNIPIVNISAKSGQGIDELLEIIILLAEMEDLQNEDKIIPASAVVIESSMHAQKGPLATLLTQKGTFQKNSELFVSTNSIGKIRSMVDHSGKIISDAPPSTPFQVIGLSSVPNVGDIITSAPVKADSTAVIPSSMPAPETEIVPVLVVDDRNTKPNIVLKADVQGSLEAIFNTIKEYTNVVSSSVGLVSDTDIQTALATNSEILGFNVKMSSSVTRLAEIDKVKFTNFKIIYQLFDYLKDLQNKKEVSLGPKIIETGQIKVLKVFNFSGTVVYGCTVVSGKVKTEDRVNGSKIISLQSNKVDVSEVKKDQEFGLVLKPSLVLSEGDIITSTNTEV